MFKKFFEKGKKQKVFTTPEELKDTNKRQIEELSAILLKSYKDSIQACIAEGAEELRKRGKIKWSGPGHREEEKEIMNTYSDSISRSAIIEARSKLDILLKKSGWKLVMDKEGEFLVPSKSK